VTAHRQIQAAWQLQPDQQMSLFWSTAPFQHRFTLWVGGDAVPQASHNARPDQSATRDVGEKMKSSTGIAHETWVKGWQLAGQDRVLVWDVDSKGEPGISIDRHLRGSGIIPRAHRITVWLCMWVKG
jgi:hypothetical protein